MPIATAQEYINAAPITKEVDLPSGLTVLLGAMDRPALITLMEIIGAEKVGTVTAANIMGYSHIVIPSGFVDPIVVPDDEKEKLPKAQRENVVAMSQIKHVDELTLVQNIMELSGLTPKAEDIKKAEARLEKAGKDKTDLDGQSFGEFFPES